MPNLLNKVAVVTGAGSGIGRALAVQLRNEGCALALSDMNEVGLAQTLAELPAGSAHVSTHTVDVSDRDAVYAHAEEVRQAHGTAHLIINNAGVGHADLVSHLEYADLEWVMNINFWGVVYGTKAFLPMMMAQNEGHVVNISSIFGIVGVPSQAAYCSSKFAVRGFTESLRQELEGTGVKVSSVHPGGVRTNIIKNARFRRAPDGDESEPDLEKYDQMFRLSASEAARTIVDGIKRQRARILVGRDAWLLDRVQRAMPTRYTSLIRRFLS
ncbi:MAG: SDR family oxidoreductase [Myxococcota bacterium]